MFQLKTDFTKTLGPMRPVHGIGNAPVLGWNSGTLMHYLGEAGIPYSRLHDMGGVFGGNRFVDIPNIFRDFDADPEDPASYDFAFTDELLRGLNDHGVKPYYRLGVTIENQGFIKAYHIYPPKDYKKWARICEHIIRHYNEGWADGFHYDIEYWEIWNEPDLDVKEGRQFTNPRTWAGTLEQFNLLYVTAACHLRSCFPDIKIGGPAYASPLKPMGDFLDCVKKHGAPLDFFSWHRYDSIPEHFADRAAKVREQLDVKGFTETESILNEWNYVRSWSEPDSYSARTRANAKGAAFMAATMCSLQNAPLDMLMYYDLRPCTSYNGAFSAYTFDPQPPYYALYYWAQLAALGTQIKADLSDSGIYVCAASDGEKVRVLLANYNDDKDLCAPRRVIVHIPETSGRCLCRITDGSRLDVSEFLAVRGGKACLTLSAYSIALLEY